MDKKMLLDEVMFDKQYPELYEAFGFDTAKKVGRNIAYSKNAQWNDEENGIVGFWTGDKEKFDKSYEKNKKGLKRRETGGKVGQGGLAAAYVGGAFLLYKGIKALYNKLKSANTPAEKIEIKSKIATKKAQLQKAKNSK